MPYWKATYWQEKVYDLFIIVTTADNNLIYKNTANTSSLTWRGCMTIFEPKTGLYVSAIPKPYIHEKKFFYFSKWRIFSNSLLFFWQNSAFPNISWFCDRIWKIIFSSESSYANWWKKLFVAQVLLEIFAKSTGLKIN